MERLTLDSEEGSSYGEHTSVRLGELTDLPEGPDTEVDIEGLDRQGPYLWITGSHSRSRKSVDPDDDQLKAVRSLANVRTHQNRHLLLRVPLTEKGVPVRSMTAVDGEELSAARLDDGPGGLSDALSSDAHLAPFLPIPGKDNGFDVEGLVALDNAILLGLRGPVLRGWAVVLELRLRPDPGNHARLVLGPSRHAYRKHFLDLDGLGVRDLCRSGDDILVLAGPTMDLDGPVRLYRWQGAAQVREAELVRGAELARVLELPYGDGVDHAEGITLLPAGKAEGREEVLVVYDSPAPSRLGDRGMLVDVVSLPR